VWSGVTRNAKAGCKGKGRHRKDNGERDPEELQDPRGRGRTAVEKHQKVRKSGAKHHVRPYSQNSELGAGRKGRIGYSRCGKKAVKGGNPNPGRGGNLTGGWELEGGRKKAAEKESVRGALGGGGPPGDPTTREGKSGGVWQDISIIWRTLDA